MPASTPKIDDLRARLKAEPKGRHFVPLAEELRKNGQLQEAEQTLLDGLKNHPNYLSAWVSLGRVLKDSGRNPEAVDALHKALALDGNNAVTARLLADTYLAMGEKVEAIKKYKLVNALLPDAALQEQIDALDRELHPPAAAEPEPEALAPESEIANADDADGDVTESPGVTPRDEDDGAVFSDEVVAAAPMGDVPPAAERSAGEEVGAGSEHIFDDASASSADGATATPPTPDEPFHAEESSPFEEASADAPPVFGTMEEPFGDATGEEAPVRLLSSSADDPFADSGISQSAWSEEPRTSELAATSSGAAEEPAGVPNQVIVTRLEEWLARVKR